MAMVVCLLLALVLLNLGGVQKAHAYWVVVDRSPTFDQVSYAHGGDESSAYSQASNGWHTVHVAKNSWAYAEVVGQNYYTGGSFSGPLIEITISNGYVSKDPYGNSYANVWCQLFDLTTGQKLYDSQQAYENTNPPPGKIFFFPANGVSITGGHTYAIYAGVNAASRWLIFQGWADAHGYVTRIFAHST
jgi:hypothetical protein